MDNTNNKEINLIKSNENDCNDNIINNKRNKNEIENKNDNVKYSKKKFYDIQLQMEITEREGNSSSSNINLFDANKFIPFDNSTDDDYFKYENEIFDDKYIEYYDNYYYEKSIVNSESIEDEVDFKK
jgi:hypothetical protein